MKIKLLIIVLLCLTVSNSISQNKITKSKQAIITSVEKHKADLAEISDKIWALAETAFNENESSKLLADYAEKQGFKVERGVAGMPTAFVATYGSGRPIIKDRCKTGIKFSYLFYFNFSSLKFIYF